MNEYIVGIDSGFYGGICFIEKDTNKLHTTHNMPIVKSADGNMLDVVKINNIFGLYNISHCYIEKVHSMPGNGIKSAFKFGGQFYSLLTLLAINSIPYTFITPHEWKKHMLIGLNSKDKNSSITRVCQLYSELNGLKITDGVAESILIAIYGIKRGIL